DHEIGLPFAAAFAQVMKLRASPGDRAQHLLVLNGSVGHPVRDLRCLSADLSGSQNRAPHLDRQALQLLGNDRHLMLPVLVSAGRGLYQLNIVDEHAAYGPDTFGETACVIDEPNDVPFRLVYDIQALSPPMEQVNGLTDLFFVDLCFGGLGAVL